MAFVKDNKTADPAMKRKGNMRRRKKVCVFCGKDNEIDYKDTAKLKRYVSESGKILPRRIRMWETASFFIDTIFSSHHKMKRWTNLYVVMECE